MRHKLAALALAALLAAPLTATAIPITYQIKFTVLSGTTTTAIFPYPSGPTGNVVEDATGNVYFGRFAVDDEVLVTDGIGKPGNVDFFYIEMEDNIWGYNLAGDNSFRGFRGPIPGNPFCMMTMACLNAPSPGFDVVNGVITNLRGGVFGDADVPFVDFSAHGPNNFIALGATRSTDPGTSFTRVGGREPVVGTMEIFRVPEPGAIYLLMLGLSIVAGAIRRVHR